MTMESITSTFRWKHSAPLLWCSWPGILKNENDFFLFVMDILRTCEEKTKNAIIGAQPLLKFTLLIRHQRYHIAGAVTFKIGTGAGASTALCPAPPLLHWGTYEVTMVRNKLDQVSGNALLLSAPSVLEDPGIMGQTEKCDDKKP